MIKEEWAKSPAFQEVQNNLQYHFINPELMLRACTHTSYVNENKELTLKSYEKLEFLGDAALGLSITEELFKKFPKQKEGELSKLRSALVNEDVLYQLALFLNIAPCLFLGKGEEKSSGRSRKSTLADVVEALFGAIYLEAGFNKVKEVILNVYKKYEEKSQNDLFSIARIQEHDAKSQLQEWTMEHRKTLPDYEVKKVTLENGPFYQATLKLEGDRTFQATEVSKKKAQQLVARNALEYLRNNEFIKVLK